MTGDHFDMPDAEQPGDAREESMDFDVDDAEDRKLAEEILDRMNTKAAIARAEKELKLHPTLHFTDMPRARQYPEPHRYDHLAAMSKVED